MTEDGPMDRIQTHEEELKAKRSGMGKAKAKSEAKSEAESAAGPSTGVSITFKKPLQNKSSPKQPKGKSNTLDTFVTKRPRLMDPPVKTEPTSGHFLIPSMAPPLQ